MEKNYKDSLLFRHAYIQQDSGTKCLDDLYYENFEVYEEFPSETNPRITNKTTENEIFTSFSSKTQQPSLSKTRKGR